MAATTKGDLWRSLKELGVNPPKHYREYSVSDLTQMLSEASAAVTKEAATPAFDISSAIREFHAQDGQTAPASKPPVPVTSERDEHAGLRQNTHGEDEPIRVDPETGFTWYRDEIRKAAFPKPRARRVMQYTETGAETMRTDHGPFYESFEVPGAQRRLAEARVTLPSYQVGIYKDPSMPFKIHIYNEKRGFDLKDVQDFYGGPDLVPSSIARDYVSTTLVYDIQSTIRAIENEHRERVLGQPALPTR